MNDCSEIERLIHLHREGERTPVEERRVLDHVARCPACAEILRSVERAGGEIAAARGAGRDVSAGAWIVDRTVDEIRRTGRGPSVFPTAGRGGPGPAIAFALLCIVVLMAQVGRDAWESVSMERRLAGQAESGRSEPSTVPGGFTELASLLMPRAKGVRAEAISRASAVPRFLTPGFGGDDLFRAYADRYPALAAVDPYDGIDERERAVLATDGQAFLEEFRMMVKTGERR